MKKKRQSKRKERLHRTELLAAIALLIVVVGAISINFADFSETTTGLPVPTAFASSDLVSQDLNIEIDQSQVYELSTSSMFNLTSLRLSGFVEGEGPAQIYLEDTTSKLLVYDNVKKKQRNKNLITGQAANDPTFSLTPSETLSSIDVEISNNEEFEDQFHNECVETCFIDFSFSENEEYKLLFYLGEGVKLRITKILYTSG